MADDLLTLKYAALAGIGLGCLPDYMCHEDIHAGRLVRVLPDWEQRRGIVHAVFPSRRGLTPAVRQFLDFLDLWSLGAPRRLSSRVIQRIERRSWTNQWKIRRTQSLFTGWIA